MKHFFTLVAALLFSIALQSQNIEYRAYINDEGQVVSDQIVTNRQEKQHREQLPQANGFPIAFGSNQYYKPFRGLALADIDGLGDDEIILSHDDTLSVIKGDGTILWQKPLTGGYAQYTPSVGDLDNDGNLEIVATTMYANSYGGINVFDKNGNQLNGFPVQTDNNPITCAAALADINNDGFLEIVFNGKGRSSQNVASGIHVWNYQGQEIEGFPFELPSTPATTPTVADINGDGNLEIFCTTTSALYACDNQGQTLQGYPIESNEIYKYSYQSPLVVDLDGEGQWNLVGACHGDNPNHYVRNALTGEYRTGWPKSLSNWSYSAPTVFDYTGQGNYSILAGVSAMEPTSVLYRYDKDGNLADGFPISRGSGAEGFISIVDIDGDGEMEILTESNGVDEYEGVYCGYIYAYELDGSEITEGFPLRPVGYTFMNGANLGDVDGDGILDLVALSYVNNMLPTDPVYINVYPLSQPMENAVFGTYKGDNTRCGWIHQQETPISCNPPQNLHEIRNSASDAYVTLSWDVPEAGSTGNLMGYNIFRDGTQINESLLINEDFVDIDVEVYVTYEYFVVAVYDDDCESTSETITATAMPDDVAETSNVAIIFPNPTKNTLTVKIDDIQQIEIYNLVGQKINTFAGEQQIIDVSGLPNGSYFVQIKTRNTTKITKILIDR